LKLPKIGLWNGGQRSWCTDTAGKREFPRKYPAFLVFNVTYRAGFLRNSLTRRLGFRIIGLEFHWSASENVSTRAEMPFLKVNGKSEFMANLTKSSVFAYRRATFIPTNVTCTLGYRQKSFSQKFFPLLYSRICGILLLEFKARPHGFAAGIF